MGKKKQKKKGGSEAASSSALQEELMSEIPAENQETKERSDSMHSDTSVHSINYVIAPETSEASGILKIPVIGIRLEKDTTTNESRLLLKIGDERPPTSILKGQGRHISAYVLYREAMINRINGQDVESVEDLLREFIKEYIDSSDVLEKFNAYLDLHKDKSQSNYDKNTRKALFEAESQTREFFSKPLPTEAECASLPQNIQDALNDLRKLQPLWTAVKPMPLDTRNQLKQGNIFSYQIPIIEAMKGILTIFNKMEQAAFEDKRDLSFQERQREGSSQGGKISNIVAKIRAGYVDKKGIIDTDKLRDHLYTTFDYPYAEISQQFDSVTNLFDVEKYFYQIVRRHIKLFFDTIPKDRLINFSEDDRDKICRNFLQDVLEKSKWYEPLVIKHKSGNIAREALTQLMPILYAQLIWNGERFQLTQKFSAQLPDNLQMAVTELEQQIEDAKEREKAAKKATVEEGTVATEGSSSKPKPTKMTKQK